jgi:serine/threonine protein kinase
VKAPLRRDARKVLQAEALTLTRLNLTPGFEKHVVPFQGFLSDSDALVMSAVPLALSTYIEDHADLRKKQHSTATMFDPVQGPESWRDMARKLITGLAWLHDTAGIIHGDIKPHNVLLRRISTDEPGVDAGAFPYEPLLADFSSAFNIPTDTTLTTPDTNQASMSAFTPPFTAPELLSLASLKSGDVAPTPSSDVFSLAATLIAAATGDLLLYPGSNNMQRLAMAREGHRILEFTRAGSNGCRVPRNGFVEKLVQPAVSKDPAQRILTRDWMALASL